MELYKQKESTHSLTKVCGYSLATHIALYNYDYHLRWDIETSFRELKYALGGISFHSKKDDFIQMDNVKCLS